MMESFLEDAENSLHHRTKESDGSYSSDDTADSMDDPFLYDKFLADPDWNKAVEEEEKPEKLVDPGPFRYNKRVFFTSLPALLFVLALGGETLVLIASFGTALVTIMAQLGDSKRCIVTFIVIFIPCHAYILGAVLPLLWLSMWHLLLVVLINAFVILTAGWVIIQFQVFRMEETSLSAVIEQLLFSVYPLLSTALVTWALSAVLDIKIVPVIFSFMWFVLLQLYLVPTMSSFRLQSLPEENLDVIQVPVVVLAVVTFVGLGPIMHVVLTLCGTDTLPLLSLVSLTHFAFILSLTCFLTTLLSVRQIFEYMGLPYTTAIYTRWVSGVLCTALCYPVLHTYGLDSHFLPLLPVAIAIFAALGVVLAFKRRKMIMAVLAVVLLVSLASLFLLWIQRMPHNLQHYFMGKFPLNVFYVIICCNFFLCLLSLWNASVGNKAALGTLLFFQSLILTICEVSLHNGGLYSTSLLQLTSIAAVYSLYRLHTAECISRKAAILISSVHSAKWLASAASLVLDRGRGLINLTELAVLACLAFATLSVFVYMSPGETSATQVTQQLLLLLCAVGVSGPHFLTPVSMLLFQGSSSYANIIGLWCLLCGGLALLYSQTMTAAADISAVVIKFALLLSLLGVGVMVVHPHLAFTLLSIFQWVEILSFFSMAVLVSCQPHLSTSSLVVVATIFSLCPGIRVCLHLWPLLDVFTVVLCVMDSTALLIVFFICFLPIEWTQATESLMKASLTTASVSVMCLLGYDVITWLSSPKTLMPALHLWQFPVWIILLINCLIISVVLKVTHVSKGVAKLPITAEMDSSSRPILPILGNVVTMIAFAVACMQGPINPTLHDLWCCASTVILGCLHKDNLTLPTLSGARQATPTVMAAAAFLMAATVLRSRLWSMASPFYLLAGLLEVILALGTFPIFYVVWGVLWKSEILNEPAAVFLAPYPILLVIIASSYTAWFLAAATFSSVIWLMMYHLPMVPYT